MANIAVIDILSYNVGNEKKNLVIEINYVKKISSLVALEKPGTCVCGQFRNFKNIQSAKRYVWKSYALKFKLNLIFFFCVPLSLPRVST